NCTSPERWGAANLSPARIAVIANAEAMKVRALSMMDTAGPATSIVAAPRTGPTTIDAWPIPARSAFARWSSSPDTNRAVQAATHGGYTALAAVAVPARTGARTIGRPAAATMPST